MSTDNRLTRVTVCSATFGPGQGYVLPSFLKSLSVRSRPAFYILPKMLYSDNLTPDQKYLHRSYLHGDEISLEWLSSIPEKRRNICLSFDLKELKGKITRILKKDQASLFVVQTRNEANANKFDEEGSSDDFTIFIGRGTNDREGLQSIPALRVRSQPSSVREPSDLVKLTIPVKVFRDMMGSFTKCKQDSQIKITIYDPSESGNEGGAGILITSRSNLNTGNIIEKYGEIPEDTNTGPNIPNLVIPPTTYDEKSVVRTQNKVQLVLIDPSLVCFQPNEFVIDPDKVSHFTSFASLHTEGTVRVYYTTGADLKFAFRFGPYGEQTVYINSNGSTSQALVKSQ